MKLSTAILGGLFFGGFGVFSTAWTVLFVLRGEVLNAFVTLGVSAFCFGLIIPMFAVVPGNVAPRVDVDDAGTTFRPDRAVDLPIQIGFGLAVIASAIYTIFAPAGMVTIPVPAAMRYSLPFTSGVLLLIAAPHLWRNLRRGCTKYLRLTPAGFVLEEGWRSESGDWLQVKDVTDQIPGGKKSTSGPIVFVMSDDSTPTIAAGGMTPDGTALRELIRFYWEHPESRDELTDGRAVERLARSLA